jgi:bidirectional [NiFe] hydrogenase diaphorase subunit
MMGSDLVRRLHIRRYVRRGRRKGQDSMADNRARTAPPSGDKRWRIVDAAMRRNGYEPNALIETLHAVQEAFGYLDSDALRYVAASLHAAPSRVYSVATFYSFFTLKPQGAHACVVCSGTACYIKGAKNLLAAFDEALHVKPGQTTEDGRVSLLTARCLGSCGLAPCAVFDGEVIGTLTPETLVERLQRWDDHVS